MSETERLEWIKRVERHTVVFHAEERPIIHPLEIEAYLFIKRKSKYKDFTTKMWQKFCDYAEKKILNEKDDFLDDDLLRYAFFLTAGGWWQENQIPYLESKWGKQKLKYLLKEDHFLRPCISSSQYHSSETMINHLTHLTLFQEKMNVSIDKFKVIIEFGGGYGGMSRLLKRIKVDNTIIIIDLPVFLIIQNYYLSNIFGKSKINLVVNNTDDIVEGKINLIDIGNDKKINLINKLTPDLFIATWSLSEANKYTQNYIFGKEYFNSKYILIGYRHYEIPNPKQPCSDSVRIPAHYSIIREQAFYAFANEQYYLFAQKLNK